MLLPACKRNNSDELIKPVGQTSSAKSLADTALGTATSAGASYCDVRIGRYLNQFISTRDLNVGISPIPSLLAWEFALSPKGAINFSATNDMSPDGVAAAARQAILRLRSLIKIAIEPVRWRQPKA